MKISRRNFLKGSAAATAVLGVSPVGATELFSPIKKISHANQFGAFYCEVQDGKIINVLPHETDERPGILTKVQVDRTYCNSRIKYPYVRKSFLEGKANHKELRGKDEFVRVSWDEAAKLVADKIKATPRDNIHNAASSGWNHPGFVNSCYTQTGRFFNIVKGGSVPMDGEYSNGASGFVNPGVVGDMEVYSYQTANKVTAENCEVMVVWGTDLFKCNKIDYNVNNRRADLDYIEWKKKGIKFISIDPIKTETAKMFDADCYYIRPGTDVAFMLGMMHYLYTSGKYDKEFMDKYTDGFDKFLPYLLGTTDGIVKDVEWAANISEIPAKDIKALADLFTSKRTYLAGNWANQRADHGEQVDWALMTLAAMIGQIGLPGGGFGFSNIDSGNGTGWTDSAGPGSFSQGRNKVKTVIPASRISECLLNPGKEINYKGRKISYPKIDLLYQCGANLVGHHPDTNTLVKALKTLDTYIVQEPWWTPGAKLADIVLPVATTMERNDITVGGAYSYDRVYAMKKVVDNPFEAKGDYEIFSLIAKQFGEKKYQKFTEGKTEMDHIKAFYAVGDASKQMSFDEFWEKGYLEFPLSEESLKFVRHSDFRADPIKNKLATETGKIQIFSQKFADYGLEDFKGHPTWFPPTEYLGKATRKHPLHMLSPHPTWRLHSQLDNTWLRSTYKVQGREPVRISPEDAKKYGIEDGELVELFNDRGVILAGAVVTKDIRPGVIAVEEGAWYSPENPAIEGSRCNSGHANVLTSSRPTSQMAQATTSNSVLVGIRKPLTPITPNVAYEPPRLA